MFGAPNPVVRQKGVAPEQSVFARHSTQAFLIVSQTGAPASAGHCALVAHPGPHIPPRQTGPAAEPVQSLFAMHSTQRFNVSQRRAPPSPALQSLPVTHCTHCIVVMSQTGRRMGPPASGMHCAELVHSTHAPVVVSQWFVAPTHAAPPSVAHEAWHVCVLGQQTGVDEPAQSPFVAQATQVPPRQTLAPFGHSALVKQSTHPTGMPGETQRTPASCPPPLLPPSCAPLLLPPLSWPPLLPPSCAPLLLPPPSWPPPLLPPPSWPPLLPLLPDPLLPLPPEPLPPAPELLPVPEPLLPVPELLPEPPELLPVPELLLPVPELLPEPPELLLPPVLPSGDPELLLLFVESPPQSRSPSDRTIAKGESRMSQVGFLLCIGTPKFLVSA